MGEGTATKEITRRRRIIERPRLTRLLDETQERIRLVVAPAGYGKTTLARQWLAGKTTAWYTGSPASTDVVALAAGLGTAAGQLVPGAGAVLMERLPVTPRPEEEADILAGMLAADLIPWPAGSWLVFDDYQTIAGVSPAERFVEALLLQAPLNVLFLTRRRPSWASSRRILYGEIFELDRSALTMTDGEAHELLADTRADVNNLVALARGWPAILALASVSRADAPELVSTPHLYRFFADEIYRRVDRASRKTLCELALYEAPGRAAAVESLGSEKAERAIQLGLDRGFLVEAADGQWEMHPLMRGFLQQKLRERSPEALSQILSRVVRNLISHELWDEAFNVIDTFGEHGLLPELIESSIDRLMESGRIASLRTWIQNAPEGSPAIMYAASQLAFRDGRFHESEVLAAAVAREAGAINAELLARAHIAAGRATHAASQLEQAIDHFRKGRLSAPSGLLQREAAYGELAAASELEWEDEATELLRALGPVELLSASDQVVYIGRKLNLETHVGLAPSLDEGRAAFQLLHFVKDPVARSSFRNCLGWILATSGHFDEALGMMAEQLEDADTCRLGFVVPYALAVTAIAHCGLHEYSTAEALLDEADSVSKATGDVTAYYMAWAARSQLYNAQGAFELTLSRPLRSKTFQPKWLTSEVSSCYGIAAGGMGESRRALEMAAAAERMSVSSEVRVNVACIRSIVALRSGDFDEGLREARLALRVASHTGVLWCFVSAYRGCPEVIVALLRDSDAQSELARILLLFGDSEGMQPVRPRDGSVLHLSPREKEVLALLAQGMSNPEIGKALFISPVTVKVHVRHIFDKLGVKSRAQAAVRAAQLTR